MPMTPKSPLKSAMRVPGTPGRRIENPLSPTFREEDILESKERDTEAAQKKDRCAAKNVKVSKAAKAPRPVGHAGSSNQRANNDSACCSQSQLRRSSIQWTAPNHRPVRQENITGRLTTASHHRTHVPWRSQLAPVTCTGLPANRVR